MSIVDFKTNTIARKLIYLSQRNKIGSNWRDLEIVTFQPNFEFQTKLDEIYHKILHELSSPIEIMTKMDIVSKLFQYSFDKNISLHPRIFELIECLEKCENSPKYIYNCFYFIFCLRNTVFV